MGEIKQAKEYYAKAFVSCSLRDEDRPFVDFVCSILEAYHIKPFGTVGKFSASPENPISLMKKNIDNADIVVVCATPRYNQQDIHNNTKTNGLSEMIHVETGMAIACDKPVVAFVEKGTNVGNALPNITQYVELTGLENDYEEKKNLIGTLLNNAYKYFRERNLKRKHASLEAKRDKENTEMWATIGKVAILALSVYVLIKFLDKK
ncbi:MAG: toll/interleukin-1 receptor domain-containing protein [Bacteroidales bacterium]|nr:toll/interleukin-1 receptor domain-containing protein [Bacteroidales bacterium]